jgi:serine protease Do
MMTRYPWIIFATACLLLSKAPSSRAADIAEIVQKAKAAIVEILTYNAKGRPLATGSGFFASPDVIITNAHVIKGASKIFARMSNGTLYPVTVKDTRGGENVDVASLVLPQASSNASFLYLSRPEVIAGQRVLVIGNPEGLEGTVSDGIVSAIRNGGKLIQITAAISPGSSGSPVLNEEGNVIGVATMTAREGQNLNSAISSRAILGLTCTPEEVERDRTILSKALLNFWTGKLALTQSQKKQARTIITSQ